MNQNKVRWGILGTARIANERLIPAIKSADNAELIAIASRSDEKARNFAEYHGIPRIYGNYESLLQDPEIDAVYIPLPNHLHAEWTVRAAKAGKHVLCEKPAALNVKEVEKMVAACREKNVMFMEAFAFRCHPQWQRVREMLDSDEIGDIRAVQAHYSVLLDNKDDIRMDPSMGGGAFYDIGCYCINAIRLIMDREPDEVRALAQFSSEKSVDQSLTAVMKFPGRRFAQFICSFSSMFSQNIEIIGTKGAIRIDWPFRHPRVTIQKNGKRVVDLFETQYNVYVIQVEHFGACILSGQSPCCDSKDSIANMKVIDAIYQSAKESI